MNGSVFWKKIQCLGSIGIRALENFDSLHEVMDRVLFVSSTFYYSAKILEICKIIKLIGFYFIVSLMERNKDHLGAAEKRV